MELQPKGCIHFQEREKQYSTLEKLVKAEIAELNNDKAEVDEKKKYVQKRLKTIAEVKMKNVIPKDNIIWNAATLIEKQLDEKAGNLWSDAHEITSRWCDWHLLLKGQKEENEEEDPCSCFHKPAEKKDKDHCQHLQDITRYKENIKELSATEYSIKEKLEFQEEERVELGKFFEEFGSKYPENVVTGLASDYNRDTNKKINDLETKLNDVHSELANYERKLHDISEDQKDKDCQCLKE